MDAETLRRARIALALLVVAVTPVDAQSTPLAELKPGSRIRVWYPSYRLEAAAGVLRSRTVDTLRFRTASGQQRAGFPIDDYHLIVARTCGC